MAYKTLPPQDYLNQLFQYDADSGKLFWRLRPVSMFADKKQPAEHNAAIWNGKNAGREACSLMASGYLETSIFRRRVLAHRLIWKLVFGIDADDIDHINGDRSDNRLSNLRNVSHQDNSRNMRLKCNNTSGAVGVRWEPSRSKWVARINVDYRTVYLGIFTGFDEAVTARKAAEAEHGFHKNHGRAA